MRVAVFSTKPYDIEFMTKANDNVGHELIFHESPLTYRTASLAENCPAVCVFVNDEVDERVLNRLSDMDIFLVALRSAGFNNVDLEAAERLGITVARVPAYSPYAVAEHAVAMILALNRKIHRAYNRVREGNFALKGLLGFDLNGRTVGIVGTGKIGRITAAILKGFNTELLAYDPYPSDEITALGGTYVPLEELLSRSHIVSLHTPLTPETHHMINADTLRLMRRGAMLINTSRGGLIDADAAIDALKSGQLGYLGMDVYEEESGLFFEDLSSEIIPDDTFARLLTFPNVLITGHQAFFTEEALGAIAQTTISNITLFEDHGGREGYTPPELGSNIVKRPQK